MKKLFATLAIVIVSVFSAMAADLTEVWSTISTTPGLISSPVDGPIAEKQGFNTLNIALNPQPSEADLAKFNEIIATIPTTQRLAKVEAEGFTVSAYATPADAAGTEYYVMYAISGENNGVRQTMALYGTMSRENMTKAMSDINLEEIIGA